MKLLKLISVYIVSFIVLGLIYPVSIKAYEPSKEQLTQAVILTQELLEKIDTFDWDTCVEKMRAIVDLRQGYSPYKNNTKNYELLKYEIEYCRKIYEITRGVSASNLKPEDFFIYASDTSTGSYVYNKIEERYEKFVNGEIQSSSTPGSTLTPSPPNVSTIPDEIQTPSTTVPLPFNISSSITINKEKVNKGEPVIVSGKVTSYNDKIEEISIELSGVGVILCWNPYETSYEFTGEIETEYLSYVGDYTIDVYIKTVGNDIEGCVETFIVSVVEPQQLSDLYCNISIDKNRVNKGGTAIISGYLKSESNVIERIYIKATGSMEVYDISPNINYHYLRAELNTASWSVGNYTIYVYVRTSNMTTGIEVATFPLDIVDPNSKSENSIGVFVNGREIVFDQQPVIKNNRTLVPIRFISEVLGANVTWNGNEQKVTIDKGDRIIELYIGRTDAYINGSYMEIDVAPEIMNGRTMVPVRFISEAFGADVTWDEVTRTIEIVAN